MHSNKTEKKKKESRDRLKSHLFTGKLANFAKSNQYFYSLPYSQPTATEVALVWPRFCQSVSVERTHVGSPGMQTGSDTTPAPAMLPASTLIHRTWACAARLLWLLTSNQQVTNLRCCCVTFTALVCGACFVLSVICCSPQATSPWHDLPFDTDNSALLQTFTETESS